MLLDKINVMPLIALMSRHKVNQPTTPPKKTGRPATGKQPMRSLRVSDVDWTAFRTAAEASGVSLAEWIVTTLRRAAKRSTRRQP